MSNTKQSIPSTPAAIAEKAKQTVSGTTIAKPNARAHLRALFDKVGNQHSTEKVFGDYHPVTIKTHLTDLKNPKYCGKLGELHIVKCDDGKSYKRVA